MAGLASQEFTNALKTLYLDPISDQVVRKHVILNRLEKNSQDIEGSKAYIALETARNPGIGFRADVTGSGPALPDHGRGSYSNATFNMAFHYGRGSVSGPVMRRSKSNKGAFARAMDIEMKGLARSMPDDLNRKMWTSGNGRAATLNVDQATSNVITIEARDYFPAKIGDRVHFADRTAAGTGITPAAGTTITAITRDSATNVHTITLATASGTSLTAADDAMYFGAVASLAAEDSSRGQTPHGIPDAVNNGNMGSELQQVGEAKEYLTPVGSAPGAGGSISFGGIDRTTAANSFWKAQLVGNSGTLRPLTTALLQKAWLTAETVGGAEPSRLEMYTNPGLWATAGLLFVGDRRLSDSMEVVGGFTAIKFNGSPLFFDRDCPRDVIWFLNMEDLYFLTQGGYEFINDDGSTLRDISDRDAWEFTIVRDVNLGAKKCKSHVKLDDITSVVTGVEADE